MIQACASIIFICIHLHKYMYMYKYIDKNKYIISFIVDMVRLREIDMSAIKDMIYINKIFIYINKYMHALICS
jgi:hypothetical protein